MKGIYKLMATRVAKDLELRRTRRVFIRAAVQGDEPSCLDAISALGDLEAELASIDARLDRRLGSSFRRHFKP